MEDEKLKALVESHDEMTIICREMMSLILHHGPTARKRLNRALQVAGIEPGFAQRAEQIRDKVSRDYTRAIAGMGFSGVSGGTVN